MKKSDLEKYLPEEFPDFNRWEAGIPKYRTPLIKRLDSLEIGKNPGRWNRAALYEIVLWELNRFPEIDDSLLRDLEKAVEIPPGEHRQGKDLLLRLLGCRCVGLTMATAILRFLNPETFQVLNARNGFLVLGTADLPSEPEELAELYFRYLDELRKLTGKGFDFRIADRMLYQIDKRSGRKL